MTGHTLKFIRFGWLSGLAVILLLGSNDILAISRRSQAPQQAQPQTRNTGPQASPTTCQAATATPPGQGRGDRGGGNPSQGGSGSPSPGGGGRGGPGGPGGLGACWWRDEGIKREIVLRDDQIRRMDALYERRAKDMAPFLQELAKETDALQQMTRERTVEDSAFAVQISKVSSLDQRIRDSRSLMNYRCYRVLDPEQYKKLLAYLDKLRADWERRGRGGAPHPAAR